MKALYGTKVDFAKKIELDFQPCATHGAQMQRQISLVQETNPFVQDEEQHELKK